MGGIDVGRWLLSGFVAGIFLWLLEAVATVFYLEDMISSLEAHGLGMEMGSRMWMVTVAVSLVAGVVLMFFYAAARLRFGPGPATALKVAVPFWIAAYVLPLAGFWLIGLYPRNLLLAWGGAALVEVIVAGLVGGMVYREKTS